uniref:Uncharacterized protein n=1 Tax=Octopus bimaculoides TaxID=37653 RepID=A0A0L8GEP3_OCTBM
MEHNRALLSWLTQKLNKNTMDQQLKEQLRKNMQHYFEVLKIVVAVIKFLNEMGLAFRGHEKKWGSTTKNGNVLGVIEFIPEFDLFLHEHLEKCKNEKVNITYLSKSVYEELIEIMGKCETGSVIVDSTLNTTHVDQLVIVVRYCYNGKPCERFLAFLPIEKH